VVGWANFRRVTNTTRLSEKVRRAVDIAIFAFTSIAFFEVATFCIWRACVSVFFALIDEHVDLLTLPTGIAKLIQVFVPTLTDTLVRVGSVNTKGIFVAVIEIGSSTLVHFRLANDTGLVLGIG